MISIEDLERIAKHTVDRNKDFVEKFSKEFSTDPSYSLEWGFEVYERAAKIKVYGRILTVLSDKSKVKDYTLELIVEQTLANVINGARWPKRSTSPSDCLMHQCMTAAYAQLYCEIMGRL